MIICDPIGIVLQQGSRYFLKLPVPCEKVPGHGIGQRIKFKITHNRLSLTSYNTKFILRFVPRINFAHLPNSVSQKMFSYYCELAKGMHK